MSEAGPGSVARRMASARDWLALQADRPSTRLGVFALFVTLAALTLSTRVAPTDPALRITLGEVANVDVAASHYFEVERVDPAALAQVRSEAAAQVRPVWDYHPDRLADAQATLRDTFDRMRARLRQEAIARLAADSAADETGEGSTSQAPPTKPPTVTEAALATVLGPDDRIAVAAAEGGLTALIGDAPPEVAQIALEALARDGFSYEAEASLMTLVEAVMTRQIVGDRAALDEVGTEGVMLRTVLVGQASEPTPERVVRNLRDFFAASDIDDLVYAASVRVRGDAEAALVDALVEVANRMARPNTEANEDETRARQDAAAEAAEDLYRAGQRAVYRPGELIVSSGEVVTEAAMQAIDQMERTRPQQNRSLLPLVGLAALTVLVVGPLVEFARRNFSRFSLIRRDLVMMPVVLLLHLASVRLGAFLSAAAVESGSTLPLEALLLATPFASGAMLVRILTNAENAITYTAGFALLTGVFFDGDADMVLFALLTGVASITMAGAARSRTEVLRSGLAAGVIGASVTLALGLVRGEAPTLASGWIAMGALVSGVTSAVAVTAALPVFEALFRYTTPLSLMELANLNHPALRELVLKAPGTYHHSMMVGQLTEAACEAVGADGLLGRVGSYFHDIGKTRNPQYFAENQSGTNPHARLKPHMSALVIRAHVKDGVEMARAYGLPERIIDFIREHHGTSLIAFFHHRALADGGQVDEQMFRYPGPKPQSRETAICLLADGIEAASRAMPDPSPARLKGLVQKMVNRAFNDGQLDQSDLTLHDLQLISQAFLTRLNAFYHHRPEYPDARAAREPSGSVVPPSASWSAEDLEIEDGPTRVAKEKT